MVIMTLIANQYPTVQLNLEQPLKNRYDDQYGFLSALLLTKTRYSGTTHAPIERIITTSAAWHGKTFTKSTLVKLKKGDVLHVRAHFQSLVTEEKTWLTLGTSLEIDADAVGKLERGATLVGAVFLEKRPDLCDSLGNFLTAKISFSDGSANPSLSKRGCVVDLELGGEPVEEAQTSNRTASYWPFEAHSNCAIQ